MIHRGTKVLAAKTRRGKWSGLGGKREDYDLNAFDTAVREVFEELFGVSVQVDARTLHSWGELVEGEVFDYGYYTFLMPGTFIQKMILYLKSKGVVSPLIDLNKKYSNFEDLIGHFNSNENPKELLALKLVDKSEIARGPGIEKVFRKDVEAFMSLL